MISALLWTYKSKHSVPESAKKMPHFTSLTEQEPIWKIPYLAAKATVLS